MTERHCIRILVAVTLLVAVSAGVLVPVPETTTGDLAVPSIAFEQASLYRLEVTLLVFYGELLLATPAFSGLVQGRLPVEVSARGARFSETTDEAVSRDEAAIEKLEAAVSSLDQRLTETTIAFERAKKAPDETARNRR